MKERAVQFGESARLVGVLTEAERPGGDAGRPAVILLNSGILHRVGSCRLHVKLARALARRGFPALRFDFSGMGDSSARRDSLPFEESSVIEIREAMDYMEARGKAGHFILGGLCSGADAAYLAALKDPRVVGIAQLDAFAYPNLRFYRNHFASRIFNAAVWRRFLNRQVRRILGGGREEVRKAQVELSPEDLVTPEYVREFPPKSEVEGNLAVLNDRGVRQFYFYSGDMREAFNYEGQFRDTYRKIDFGDSVTVRYEPEADHILTRHEYQECVIGEIGAWAGKWWDRPVPETVADAAPAAEPLAVGGAQ